MCVVYLVTIPTYIHTTTLASSSCTTTHLTPLADPGPEQHPIPFSGLASSTTYIPLMAKWMDLPSLPPPSP
ncbi:hypothetical protein Pmani_006339 [Petrolisthes manimaculis]|uniref:Uncharacterized protein n=1 Tax=Petrolisthes manimaculis TaxID=1843537 RepID=A0AAE1UJP3_9EUCA|nr:hypothetical protein Pmani_006339 [Petrolisthes manimaculis]